MDVQPGGLRLAGQLAEALDKLLLEVVGDVVLLPEEDNAALGDCEVLDRRSSSVDDDRQSGLKGWVDTGCEHRGTNQ